MRNQVRIDGDTATIIAFCMGKRYEILVDTECLPLLDDAAACDLSLKPDGSLYPFLRYSRKTGKRKRGLHAVVLGIAGDGTQVGDHMGGDTFDCRKSNLRRATHSINSLNRTRASPGKTGVRGVFFENGAWRARIRGEHLGRFADPKDATEAVYQKLIQIDPVSAANFLRNLPDATPKNPDYPHFAEWFGSVQSAGRPELVMRRAG